MFRFWPSLVQYRQSLSVAIEPVVNTGRKDWKANELLREHASDSRAVRRPAGADPACSLCPHLAGRLDSRCTVLVGGYSLLAPVQPYVSDHQASPGLMRVRCTVDPGVLRALCKSKIHSTDRPAGDRRMDPKGKRRWLAGER